MKFFRRIRKTFLLENKLGKYLPYAIGEIVLVVIGILIALQINNWNQNRKTEALTITYLKNIKSELRTDTTTYGEGIRRIEKSIENTGKLMSFDYVSKLSNDALINLLSGSFHSTRIYKINNSTFQKMTNTGFLESSSFKDIFLGINEYYNKEYSIYQEFLNWDIEVDINIFDYNFLGEWYDKITFPDLNKEQKAEYVSDRKVQSEMELRELIDAPRFRNYNWSYSERKKRILGRMKYQKKIAEELIISIDNSLNLK